MDLKLDVTASLIDLTGHEAATFGGAPPVTRPVGPGSRQALKRSVPLSTELHSSRTWQTLAKRTVDVIGAAVLLLLTIPLLLIVALGVRISSPGPVLFRQQRIGRGGELFRMLKFRTFPVDHIDLTQSLPTEACPLPFGRLLRRTSLDELPQLWNVLRGDMSLVGPRPERPQFATHLADSVPGYRERHRMPVGITGLAQINGLCGPTSISDRVKLDNEYIETWSLRQDAKILLHTVPTLLRKARW